ncbi:MAG: four helix bundle protein [Nitrospirota bacterium]
MKRLMILLVLLLGLVIAPTKSAFALQINWADIFVTPNGDPSIVGGYLGGDGDQVSSPNEWIDWSIGNCVPFSGTVTSDMVFSTAVGNFITPANWYERMRITKNGNVGIGTAKPLEKLTVAGTIASTHGGFKFPDGSIQTTAASAGGHYVGELYGGGVVFYVDHTGNHGVICSMINISTSQVWSNVSSTLIGPTAQSDWNGQGNTNAIIGQDGHSNSAAKLCDGYTNSDYGSGSYSDWYLPTIAQLNKLYNAVYEVNKALDSDENGATTGLEDLWIYTLAEDLEIKVHEATKKFPVDEKYRSID